MVKGFLSQNCMILKVKNGDFEVSEFLFRDFDLSRFFTINNEYLCTKI